ncbi:MAG: hypothetical protein HQ567_34065 [Candidatus Nealsonbacteria bacterium]|nr:hypothetical protein [Candidatus Nealsonbacteria bacterium]
MHLFEFCDQSWVPRSARECLYEIMEFCNSGCRKYNQWMADSAWEIARREGLDTIVELGAGRAPITTLLGEDESSAAVTLVPCDLVPDEQVFRDLAARYPDRVKPIYKPVDISNPELPFQRTLLILPGVLHHIPFASRGDVVAALSRPGRYVVVVESQRRTWFSILFTLTAIFPTLALPLAYLRRGGRLRRFLWCWLLPIVPPMFLWDGVVSCLRQWSVGQWHEEMDRLKDVVDNVEIRAGRHWLRAVWSGRSK